MRCTTLSTTSGRQNRRSMGEEHAMRELTARALTTAGGAWGISGPTFLVGYFVFAVAATIIALRARRAIRAESPGQPASGWDSDPYHQQYSSDAKNPNDYRAWAAPGCNYVPMGGPPPDRPKRIYVRISQDREGAELGVARQEADCRALCERKAGRSSRCTPTTTPRPTPVRPGPRGTGLISDLKAGTVSAGRPLRPPTALSPPWARPPSPSPGSPRPASAAASSRCSPTRDSRPASRYSTARTPGPRAG